MLSDMSDKSYDSDPEVRSVLQELQKQTGEGIFVESHQTKPRAAVDEDPHSKTAAHEVTTLPLVLLCVLIFGFFASNMAQLKIMISFQNDAEFISTLLAASMVLLFLAGLCTLLLVRLGPQRTDPLVMALVSVLSLIILIVVLINMFCCIFAALVDTINEKTAEIEADLGTE